MIHDKGRDVVREGGISTEWGRRRGELVSLRRRGIYKMCIYVSDNPPRHNKSESLAATQDTCRVSGVYWLCRRRWKRGKMPWPWKTPRPSATPHLSTPPRERPRLTSRPAFVRAWSVRPVDVFHQRVKDGNAIKGGVGCLLLFISH